MRIAYFKKDNSLQAGNHDGFKNTLEAMFAEADLDLKKRGREEPVIGHMIELNNSEFFSENFYLLASIFLEKAMHKEKGDHLELSKSEFINILKESEILLKPKAASKVEEGKGGDKKKEEKKEEENKA